MVIINMYTNDISKHRDFLVPSSIPRILPSNRQLCAFHSEISSTGSVKKTYISPKKSQQDS